MSHYYEENDLERFDEIGKYRPDLFDIFMNYYQGVMSAGALTTREKALIALAVAHAVNAPTASTPIPGVPGSRLQYGGDDRSHSRGRGHPGRRHPDSRHPGP